MSIMKNKYQNFVITSHEVERQSRNHVKKTGLLRRNFVPSRNDGKLILIFHNWYYSKNTLKSDHLPPVRHPWVLFRHPRTS